MSILPKCQIRIKTWRKLSIFALLGLLLSWVVSCSTSNVSNGAPQTTSGSVSIEFWTMQLQPEFTDYFKELIGNFELENPGIEKVQVLLVATRKEVTDTYMATFQQAGLKVDVLEINSFALLRTIREQLRQFSQQEAAVLVDIEFDNTEIAMVVDGVPQFSRTVPIGTYQLQSAILRAMNLPASRDTQLLQEIAIPTMTVDAGRPSVINADQGTAAMLRVLGELTDELRRSIDFYLNQSENLEVAQILLAGPGGGLRQLDEFFTQRLSLPTIQVDPVAALSLEVDEEKITASQRPGLGIVLGLGLREVWHDV